MKIVHQQWQIVGQILIVDDEDNAIVVGKDAQGNEAKLTTVQVGVPRFRGNEFAEAYNKAREACAVALTNAEAYNKAQTPPADPTNDPSAPKS